MEFKVTVTKQLYKELKLATQEVLRLKGLQDSKLYESIEWDYKNNQFMLVSYDYFTFVSTGRRPRARKVPVEDLIRWMKEKNVMPLPGRTYNQTAFAIQQAIYKNGIISKNYIPTVEDVSTDIISEDIATVLADQIGTEIVTIIEELNTK